MSTPYRFWTPAAIAAATACNEVRIREAWPFITAALERFGIDDRPTQMAALATIAIETASTFAPVKEAFWLGDDYRASLRYAPFWGRGFIQLTWESNYRAAGKVLGVDLIGDPDLALFTEIAAPVLAWYFNTHGGGPLIPQAARRGDWREVRRLVQGGTDGLDRLVQIVSALGGSVTMPVIPFNPDAKCDVQNEDWKCALESVQWLLRSIGRNPDVNDPVQDAWLISELVPGIISRENGLNVATGVPLAEWVTRTYGVEMGFVAQASPVEFADVLAGAGVNPMMIGGRRYGPAGHWVGIRRADENGWLELANPAPNYTQTGTHLDPQEWADRGPWSCVWIDRMSTLEPAPPPPPPDPHVDLRQRVRAVLEDAGAQIDALLAET